MLHNAELTRYYTAQLKHIKERYDYLCQKVFDAMEHIRRNGTAKSRNIYHEMRMCQKEMLQLDEGRQLIFEKIFNK